MDQILHIVGTVFFALAIPPLPLRFSALAAGAFCFGLATVI